VWGYTYNGREQLAIRTLTTGGTDVTHFIHDIFGNVIAENGGGGPPTATGTLREYIWLPEAGIAPTMSSSTEIARPLPGSRTWRPHRRCCGTFMSTTCIVRSA
jgi:hypothetical protein